MAELTTPDEQAERPPARNPARAWAIRAAGTLLFAALLLWLDLRGDLDIGGIFATLGRANLALVTLSIGLYLPFLLIKTARWRIVSEQMHMPVVWPQAWRIYAIGLAAGTFTPGQAGDAFKAWYMQRMGYPLARALGSSILDRIFDVAALALLGLLGVAVYGGRFAGQTPALIGLSLLTLGAVAFFAYNPTRRWAVNLVVRRLTSLLGSRKAESADWSLNAQSLLWVAILTVASFATSIFRVWLLAAALGLHLGPLEVSGYVGLTTAAALVPVSVGGIGTRDAVSALALQQLGQPPEVGIALSALILLLNLAQALAGWVIWLRHRAAEPKATVPKV